MLLGQDEVSSAPPLKSMWLFIGLGAVLASEIATILSLTFLFFLGSVAFMLTGTSSGLIIYFVAAPLAGLLTGWFFWWLFILKPGHATIGRGVLLGVLSGVTAHPFMWAFASLSLGTVGHPFMPQLPPALQWVYQSGIALRFVEILEFTVASLLYVGWITAVVGGVVGGLLIFFQRTRFN